MSKVVEEIDAERERGHDPNRPEDVLKVDADEDGNGGEDAADGLPKPATRWMPQARDVRFANRDVCVIWWRRKAGRWRRES
jgi:hypothetical protein